MTVDEIVKRLEPWRDRYDELSEQLSILEKLTGADPAGSPLFEAIWSVWEAYTDAMSELVGDKNEFLEWYQQECAMGGRPRKTSSFTGKKIVVSTLQQLAEVLSDESWNAKREPQRR